VFICHVERLDKTPFSNVLVCVRVVGVCSGYSDVSDRAVEFKDLLLSFCDIAGRADGSNRTAEPAQAGFSTLYDPAEFDFAAGRFRDQPCPVLCRGPWRKPGFYTPNLRGAHGKAKLGNSLAAPGLVVERRRDSGRHGPARAVVSAALMPQEPTARFKSMSIPAYLENSRRNRLKIAWQDLSDEKVSLPRTDFVHDNKHYYGPSAIAQDESDR
jgi:hypothetical protein